MPDGWLAEATTERTGIGRPGRGYGYQRWTYTDGVFTARGILGKGIFIDPVRKLVIVSKANWAARTNDRATSDLRGLSTVWCKSRSTTRRREWREHRRAERASGGSNALVRPRAQLARCGVRVERVRIQEILQHLALHRPMPRPSATTSMRSTDARSQPRDGDRDIEKEAVRPTGTETQAELAAVERGGLAFAVIFHEFATRVRRCRSRATARWVSACFRNDKPSQRENCWRRSLSRTSNRADPTTKLTPLSGHSGRITPPSESSPRRARRSSGSASWCCRW